MCGPSRDLNLLNSSPKKTYKNDNFFLKLSIYILVTLIVTLVIISN